ncbi:hypothetical protein AtubIFM55763_008226 [Aspergillus tubingensis]|uniref:Uncharacterized protein n=1 Tax=Aspergillus tubingensis TaxID=5068 RepID=A0A9W6ELX0_ASPTU|nr:hypothetical protein AtubIFM55763_008226 [Aspergillus tubingensis]GLA84658.1 hypothetical protein AtubIFM56815_008873 [Aspergillus tubingensis]GLB21548.1 hypothetical protein AtubIFM61612_002096 [Aspergillus tubingensis]
MPEKTGSTRPKVSEQSGLEARSGTWNRGPGILSSPGANQCDRGEDDHGRTGAGSRGPSGASSGTWTRKIRELGETRVELEESFRQAMNLQEIQNQKWGGVKGRGGVKVGNVTERSTERKSRQS